MSERSTGQAVERVIEPVLHVAIRRIRQGVFELLAIETHESPIDT